MSGAWIRCRGCGYGGVVRRGVISRLWKFITGKDIYIYIYINDNINPNISSFVIEQDISMLHNIYPLNRTSYIYVCIYTQTI